MNTGQGINKIVPSRTVHSAAPISLSASARPGSGVTVSISDLSLGKAQGSSRGQHAGPIAVVKVRVSNARSTALSLSSAQVTMTDSAGRFFSPLESGPTPLPTRLAAHRNAVGVYDFGFPRQHTARITVSFSYSTDVPVVVFKGTLS